MGSLKLAASQQVMRAVVEALCLGLMCSCASGNIILKAGLLSLLPSLALTWRIPACACAEQASLLPADRQCHL